MIKFFAAALMFLLSLVAASQFSDSLTQFAKLSMSGNVNRTNLTTSYLLTNEARYSIKNPKTVLNSYAGWIYGKQASLVTNNDFMATLDFNVYNKHGNFYYWGLANYTTSLSLRINNQLQAGLGVAYNFVNNPKTWVNVSNGLLFETSNIKFSDAVNENYHTVRNSFRIAYRFVFKDLVTLSGINFFQQSFDNSQDYIIRSNNSAGLKLNKWLALAASVSYNQFQRTGTENLLVTYGLTAEKYF